MKIIFSKILEKKDLQTQKNKTTSKRGFIFGDPERIRTSDPQLRRLLLYPAELRDRQVILYIFLF